MAMTIYLDDKSCRASLVPFSSTRHVSDIRLGILTFKEKWELLTGYQVITELIDDQIPDYCIPANWVPTLQNFEAILNFIRTKQQMPFNGELHLLVHPWQLFSWNEKAISDDFVLITSKRVTAKPDPSNTIINPSNVFIEDGATVTCSILNASAGPIYIGKNALIMEGCMIRGGFSLGESSVVKMGAKIYGATSIGPHCVVGGEIKNSILFGYSNKAHDGYLGDSVIGYWCNIGAGTSNSNVKNTGSTVRFKTSNVTESITAGLKGGLLMGDYSRCAINTSFYTATTIAVCCNIFGAEIPDAYVPDFCWGKERYQWEKVLSHISCWMAMKGKVLNEKEKNRLEELYNLNK